MPTIVCPGCQAKLKFDETAGKKLRCPQCQTRIRVDETGEVSFVSETIRRAEPKPRKPESASAGWIVYGIGAALVSVLLVVVWQATSRTAPKKSGPPGGGLIAEQDADVVPVSPAEKETSPADDLAAEARKQLQSLAHFESETRFVTVDGPIDFSLIVGQGVSRRQSGRRHREIAKDFPAVRCPIERGRGGSTGSAEDCRRRSAHDQPRAGRRD